MVNRHVIHDSRVSELLIRTFGDLALTMHDTTALQLVVPASNLEWHARAEELLGHADAIFDGACANSHPGDSISIIRSGVAVPIDQNHILRTIEGIRRHVKLGTMLIITDPPIHQRPQPDTTLRSAEGTSALGLAPTIEDAR